MNINDRAFLVIVVCMGIFYSISLQAWFGALLTREALKRISYNQDIPEMRYQRSLSRDFDNELPSYEEAIFDILIHNCTVRKHFLSIAYGDLYIKDFQKMVRYATKLDSSLMECFLGHLYVNEITHIALKKENTAHGEKIVPLTRREVRAALNKVACHDSANAVPLQKFLRRQSCSIKRSQKNRWA
jgi:hypothetical protein